MFDKPSTRWHSEGPGALGISEAGVVALASAGHFGTSGAGGLLRRDVDDLAERIGRAALWPEVIAALLDGHLNAFRRRGAFGGGVLSSLMISSKRVVAELAPTSGGVRPNVIHVGADNAKVTIPSGAGSVTPRSCASPSGRRRCPTGRAKSPLGEVHW